MDSGGMRLGCRKGAYRNSSCPGTKTFFRVFCFGVMDCDGEGRGTCRVTERSDRADLPRWR